ncbi:50S ribosomal protein L11 methyltransferase [Calderihabitans maritimus]|uniref:Ribosomal protein L11 methyltransferase n=1 Tax=Calderihabitans maritimus TaxID=1246530 RepID=A0A1Z5HV84_9FIRM|nr:50S ribosomal protein L11 methyltransferase [Calderihabitans maritimus]GAW93449.1 ribosomal protein L11 methyltransferase [Calderihabitans maritimus]
MKWQEITVTTTEEAVEAVADLFHQVGAAGVVIEDPKAITRYIAEEKWDYYELPRELLEAENVVIKGYLPIDENLQQRLQQLRRKLEEMHSYFTNYLAEISLAEVRESDWENCWKRYYKPQKIGQRLVICPSWESYQPSGDEMVIRMDPGMAFGTGTHPTTALCIRALDKHLRPGKTVFDVGTGSGILAIVAAKLGASRVLAIDLDPLAVKVAQANVARNGVNDVVKVVNGDLLTDVFEQADCIVANIVANAIITLAGQAYERLVTGGCFISSGIIKERLEEVRKTLQNAKFKIIEENTEGEWGALVARKE